MKQYPYCIRMWSSTPKQSSDLTNRFVNVWLALVVKRTKLQITQGSTLETDLEMKDLPPCGRTTTMKIGNNSIVSSARSGPGCPHASRLLVQAAGRPQHESVGWRRRSLFDVGCNKSAAMVTTRQWAAQRLSLNISPTGAQENVFYKSEGTYHGIINHSRKEACHGNIIRSKNWDTQSWIWTSERCTGKQIS
jgi:hypothetical protein